MTDVIRSGARRAAKVTTARRAPRRSAWHRAGIDILVDIRTKGTPMALWLVLIIAGLVSLVLGLVGLGNFFVWAGVIAMVVGVVLVLVNRGNRKVG
jgi:hypothetical protein